MRQLAQSTLGGLPGDAALAPTSSAQRGIWSTLILEPDSTAYHIGHAFDIHGPLDMLALRTALARLVARHEVLRTGFTSPEDGFYQVIHRTVSCDVAVLPVPTTDEEGIQAAVSAEFHRRFMLDRPPLLRATVFPVADRRHVLTLVVHHLIADAQSVDRLWRELADMYEEAVGGRPAVLAEIPLEYADYAGWESEWLESAEYRADVDFFRDRLRDAPKAIDLPLPARDVPAWHGGTERLVLSADLTEALLAFGRSRRVTPFTLLLTIFAGVLHRWSGQSVVVIGTPASVRSDPGLENAVGLFINSVILPTRWGDDPPFDSALVAIRDLAVECLARQRCPFGQLVADLRPSRDPRRAPVFQVLYTHANAVVSPPRLAGLTVEQMVVPVPTAKFELSLDTALVDGRLHCDLEWSAQRFTPQTAACFLDHFRVAAEHVVRDPRTRVGEWLMGQSTPAGPAAVTALKTRSTAASDLWPQDTSGAEGENGMSDETDDVAAYTVVVNDEEQYSIWLADRGLPLGWRAVGVTGTRAECLGHIDRVWTDMRPASLRAWMASAGDET